MRGYWQRPEATDECLDGDGWLATGDIASMDERGFVSILDRKKDMILVSGFNVYPNEVEQVAVSHPGVLEAGVIGIPDDHSGKAVRPGGLKKDSDLERRGVAAPTARRSSPATSGRRAWSLPMSCPRATSARSFAVG